MKNITYLFLLLFLCSSIKIAAQPDQELNTTSSSKHQMQDVIYLKNGSILKGKIKEHVYGEYAKIQVIGGSEFVLKYEEIETISAEKIDNKLIPRVFRDFKVKQRGIYNAFNLGFMPGIGGDGWFRLGVSLDYAVGYQINNYVGLGLGISSDFYMDNPGIIPIYLDVRGYALKKSTSPYYRIGIGYGLTPNTQNVNWRGIYDMDGGIMFNAEVGVRLPTRKQGQTTFSIGQRIQKAKLYGVDNQWNVFPIDPGSTAPENRFIEKILYNRTTLRVGFVF